jgi:hypothetical protein
MAESPDEPSCELTNARAAYSNPPVTLMLISTIWALSQN